MKQRRPPGPVGTSCLTCKRRRKKCDQGQPACARCIKGGYECLGYSHIQRCGVATGAGSSSSRAPPVEESVPLESSPPKPVELRNKDGKTPVGQRSDQPPECNYHILPSEITAYELIVSSADSSLGVHGHGLSFNARREVMRTTSIGDTWLRLLPTTNQSWEQACSSSPSPAPSESKIQLDPTPAHILNYLIPSVEPRIVRTLSTLSPDAKQAITFFLSQFERVLRMVYFTPKRQQIMHFRDVVLNRLQASSVARCGVFIGANIVQSCVDGTTSDRRASLSKSVEQFERRLLLVSSQMTAPDEVQNCLLGFLQVTYLKMVLNSGLACQLLRSIAPTFLQIVYSDPTLWPNPRGPPAISLARVISSPRYELSQFALMDMAYAMVYGLPQMLEYDTSVPVIDNDNNFHPTQNFHACPPEFQICLAEINLRCSRGYISHDWHLIERRLLSYKPYLSHIEHVESWKVVAQLAVVETWRQLLLIYLYMAVCGVASDDPRVQSAVQQIFQLFKTVPYQGSPRVYAHFMFQYIIAGACTRSEKQRSYVRKKLLDPHESVLWLLPCSKFVPVLDHLWHGAAANGEAFKWSDYIFSRHAALPVPVDDTDCNQPDVRWPW